MFLDVAVQAFRNSLDHLEVCTKIRKQRVTAFVRVYLVFQVFEVLAVSLALCGNGGEDLFHLWGGLQGFVVAVDKGACERCSVPVLSRQRSIDVNEAGKQVVNPMDAFIYETNQASQTNSAGKREGAGVFDCESIRDMFDMQGYSLELNNTYCARSGLPQPTLVRGRSRVLVCSVGASWLSARGRGGLVEEMTGWSGLS
jgi:hypothetical protein